MKQTHPHKMLSHIKPFTPPLLPLHHPFTTATNITTPTPTTLATLVLKTTNPKTLTKTLHSYSFSETLVNQTLKHLWNHAPKALQFFTILHQHPSYSHPISSFNHAIDISGRLRDYHTLWSLVDKLKSLRIGPTSRTFSIIIERYVAAGRSDRALKIFMGMEKHGCVPDLNMFNNFVDILCKAGHVEKAHELVRVFRGRFRVDLVCYNVIANGYCLKKQVNKALEVLRDMVDRGVMPNLSSYNVILKGYFRTGQVSEAWRFWKEMKRRGCEVDVVSYTTVIHGFGVVGDIDRARRLFDEMVKDGVLPNVATYNALIQVLCKKDSVENAIVVFDEMCRKGYVPNLTSYNLLIRGFCHRGEMDRALEFVEVMKKDGFEPNVQTFNMLIRYYCDVGEIEKGLSVFDRMGSGECLPNLDTFNVLISSMFVRQKPEDLVVAGRLLIEMVERGFVPTKLTFKRVLDGLLVTGNQPFAKEVLQLQSKCGFQPRNFRL